MHCIKAGENRQFESYTAVSCKAEEDLVQDPPGDHPRNTPILSPWGKLKGTDQKKKYIFRDLTSRQLGDLSNLQVVVQVSSTKTYFVNIISTNCTFTGETCPATIISPVKYLPKQLTALLICSYNM